MPVLQLDDQQFPLRAGLTRIGAGGGADVVVPGYSELGIEAIIETGATPTIRRAVEEAHVRVNGVLLGAEPVPLIHGDKVEVAGLELRFADDAKGGATQYVSASEIAALAGSKRTGAARATAASGGRVVSLVDGKEYAIAESGLVFGRDATCDVVVAQAEVSRRHAEIVPEERGYVVRDISANGLFVNGERIQGSHLLARADVIRIGSEEFRFYADMAPAARAAVAPAAREVAAPAVPVATPDVIQVESTADFAELDLLPLVAEPVAAAPVAPPVAAPAPPAAAPPAPPPAPKQPPPSVPAPKASAPPREDPRPVLAVLEALNEGPDKGRKHELRTPLAHIGRGAYNDVVLTDESVSDVHAKLQRREEGWFVVDMESTNGTYVGGTRITGERRLEGAPDVRFGGLKFRFTPVGAASEAKGTRAIAAMRPSAAASSQATAKSP
ncbi:MAG TPA: FHA domain-containing protein, partial [Gemmatimonadaceae bacterium]